MIQISVNLTISAPADIVFRAVADLPNLPQVSPDVVGIEMLSETTSGVGTRFRETRKMKNGKQMLTDLEVLEYRTDEHLRIVTDSHGTVWDTTFSVREVEGGAELQMVMDARPHKLVPKILNPLMKGMFRKGMLGHLEDVATWCEREAAADG